MVPMGQLRGRSADLCWWCGGIVHSGGSADGVRFLVLQENEKATDHHMKSVASLLLVSILIGAQQALACPFCYGAKDGKATEHMAVAIWFLFGAVMSVLGGIGAFSFHLWRHGRMPIEPHQELTEEDLSKYE
jgi:hypothetical protein